MTGRQQSAKLQLEFIREARAEGHADAEIREVLRAYKYANRSKIWQDTSRDQAPSAIVCADDSTNWFKVLEGDRARISNHALYNGIFGHRESVESAEEARRIDDLTHILYIVKHGLLKNNPLPAYIIMGGSSKSSAMFGNAVELVKARFGKLVDDSHATADMIDQDTFSFKNMKTGQVCKLRTIGMICNEEEGKFYVLELGRNGGEPVEAVEWLSKPKNIAYLLGISIEELARLEKEVLPAHEGKSWQRNVRIYPKHAQLVWSYQAIVRHRENLREYGADAEERELEAFMNADMVGGCVDSRQSGRIKVLGTYLTKEEISEILHKPDVKGLLLKPHLKCGYWATVMALHSVGREMDRAFAADGKSAQVHEAKKFFAANMQRFFLGDYKGPLAEPEIFDHHMEALGIEKESKTYEKLYEIFVKNEQLTRNALRHAYENGVIVWDKKNAIGSVPVMRAAYKVDAMLEKFNCAGEVGQELYGVLVTEEIARQMKQAGERVLKNDPALEGKWFSVLIEEFSKGGLYNVPQRPESREQLIDAEREDAYLGKLRPEDFTLLRNKDGEKIGMTFDVLQLVK
jgi:hypothetical protein